MLSFLIMVKNVPNLPRMPYMYVIPRVLSTTDIITHRSSGNMANPVSPAYESAFFGCEPGCSSRHLDFSSNSWMVAVRR
jgi:hypothetical protein